MHKFIDHEVDTEAGDGAFALEGWTVTFNVSWEYNYDGNWLATAEFYSGNLHNLTLDRDAFVALVGDIEAQRVEEKAAEVITENWRDYQEAAE